jgi:hypothetical protein
VRQKGVASLKKCNKTGHNSTGVLCKKRGVASYSFLKNGDSQKTARPQNGGRGIATLDALRKTAKGENPATPEGRNRKWKPSPCAVEGKITMDMQVRETGGEFWVNPTDRISSDHSKPTPPHGHGSIANRQRRIGVTPSLWA